MNRRFRLPSVKAESLTRSPPSVQPLSRPRLPERHWLSQPLPDGELTLTVLVRLQALAEYAFLSQIFAVTSSHGFSDSQTFHCLRLSSAGCPTDLLSLPFVQAGAGLRKTLASPSRRAGSGFTAAGGPLCVLDFSASKGLTAEKTLVSVLAVPPKHAHSSIEAAAGEPLRLADQHRAPT